MQEKVRKDVERCFGVLQACFAIIVAPARLWETDDIAIIMQACIILHNMIVDNERDLHYSNDYETTTAAINTNNGASTTFESFAQRFKAIRDADVSIQLKADLIEHLW